MNRKVFVASQANQETINATYQFPEGFERTTNLEDAEFIVVDLVNLPADWVGYPWKKKAISVPETNLPILFVALEENIAPQFTDIKNLFKPADPPVYRSAAELYNALQWFQLIFPFYNETRAPALEKAVSNITLARFRTNPG